MATSAVVRRSCGSVIDHRRRHAPAPSSAAASSKVEGRDWSAAR